MNYKEYITKLKEQNAKNPRVYDDEFWRKRNEAMRKIDEKYSDWKPIKKEN